MIEKPAGCPDPQPEKKSFLGKLGLRGSVATAVVSLASLTAPVWIDPVRAWVDRASTPLAIQVFKVSPAGEIDPGTEVTVAWKVTGAKRVWIPEIPAGVFAAESDLKLYPATTQQIHLWVEGLNGEKKSETASILVRTLQASNLDASTPPAEQKDASPPTEAPEPVSDPRPAEVAQSAEPQSTPTPPADQSAMMQPAPATSAALHQGSQRVCLELGRIIAVHDGSAGSTDWIFRVYSGDSLIMASHPISLNDGQRTGTQLRQSECGAKTLQGSGSIPVRVEGWKEGREKVAEGVGALYAGSFAQLLPVKNTKDEKRGSFLIELSLTPPRASN